MYTVLTYFEFHIFGSWVFGFSVVAEKDVLGLQIPVNNILAHHGLHGTS